MKPNNFCCERFKDFYDSGELVYAYEKSSRIDETDWIIDGLAHCYYCPFCGSFIKGKGFGNYDERYSPNKKPRIIEQKKRANIKSKPLNKKHGKD
jgi:hypothetical protein